MEHTGQPCSTVTMRLVFFTDAMHGLGVERTQRAQIDQFGVDAFGGKLFGRFQNQTDANRMRDQRDVLALL